MFQIFVFLEKLVCVCAVKTYSLKVISTKSPISRVSTATYHMRSFVKILSCDIMLVVEMLLIWEHF